MPSSEKASKTKEKVIIVSELRQKYKLDNLLAYANLSKSTYYYHTNNFSKPDKYMVEKPEILDIFNQNKGRYGYRRILLELKNLGYVTNHKTVLKLMKSLSIQGKQRKNKYKSYKGDVGYTYYSKRTI